MRIKRRSDSPWKRKARRGFRGYPVATIAVYGPDDKHATKVAVGILGDEGRRAGRLPYRWFAEDRDVRSDVDIGGEILRLIQGADYPEGAVCPQCPYWANRDRWTGNLVQ